MNTVNEPLGIVVLSGEYERAHYGLMMASSAAALGRAVVLFVTMDGLPLLVSDKGWQRLENSEKDKALRARNVADMETLLEACVALDVQVIVCEAGLKALDIDPSALREDVHVEVAGLATFYRAVGNGQITCL